jgi:hypothetical protein
VESSCELGNEPSGSIKCWESIEWLQNLWPLERYSAPQSMFVIKSNLWNSPFRPIELSDVEDPT